MTILNYFPSRAFQDPMVSYFILRFKKMQCCQIQSAYYQLILTIYYEFDFIVFPFYTNLATLKASSPIDEIVKDKTNNPR